MSSAPHPRRGRDDLLHHLRRLRRVEAPPLLLRLRSAVRRTPMVVLRALTRVTEGCTDGERTVAVRAIKSYTERRIITRTNASDQQPTGSRKPITLSSKWSCEHLVGEGGPEKWCAAPLSIRLLHHSVSRLIAITDITAIYYFVLLSSYYFAHLCRRWLGPSRMCKITDTIFKLEHINSRPCSPIHRSCSSK